jgi:hypothetical protein
MVENLDEGVLGEIHNALSNELLNRIRSGEATPTDLNVARQMLKDNNITVTPALGNPLLNIAEELPYDDSTESHAKIISQPKEGTPSTYSAGI